MNSAEQDRALIEDCLDVGKSFVLPVGTPLQLDSLGSLRD